jgi:hypothetical protein
VQGRQERSYSILTYLIMSNCARFGVGVGILSLNRQLSGETGETARAYRVQRVPTPAEHPINILNGDRRPGWLHDPIPLRVDLYGLNFGTAA